MITENQSKRNKMKTMTDSRVSAERTDKFTSPVVVYYNPDAGSSEKVLELIRNDPRIQLEAVAPLEMAERIKRAVAQKARRVVVSGGDGTISLAASQLAGTTTELGVIPSGTLNHFAQRTGIPTDVKEALNVALIGVAQPVDVGYVNDLLFINTSSVGAYPTFVRSRNYLENRMHYFPASIIAGIRRLLKFRSIRVSLADKELRTPLVFIGVGERELGFPALGQIKVHGCRSLHFIAVHCKNKMQGFMLVIKSIFWGVDPIKKKVSVENSLVNNIELNFRSPKKRVIVALDGELKRLRAPLRYRFAAGEILVVLPD